MRCPGKGENRSGRCHHGAVSDVPGGAVTSPCGTKGKSMSHIMTELQAVDKRRIR